MRVARRRLLLFVMTAPSRRATLRESMLEEALEDRVDSSRVRRSLRAVKRKMSSYPLDRSYPRLQRSEGKPESLSNRYCA